MNASKLILNFHKIYVKNFSSSRAIIPGPKGLPIIGTTLELIAAGSAPKLHLYVDQRHKQFGPVYKETLGPVDALFVSNPTYIRKVFSVEGKFPEHLLPDGWIVYNKIFQSERGLFFMKGEEWLHYRQIMNRLLLKNELTEGVLKSYEYVIKCLINEWKQYNMKEIQDLNKHLYNLSVSFVIANLIGSSYPEHRALFQADVDKLSLSVYSIFKESSKLSLMPAKLAAFLRLPVWKRFVTAVSLSVTTATKMVKEMLPLTAKDGLLHKMSSESIPFHKLVSIVVDLIIAAADTTPHTLGWSLYLLGQDSSLQDKIAKAVKAASTSTEVMLMPLIRSVPRETLRMYPAAPFLTRVLPNESNIGGYFTPPGQMVIMPLYTTGRNEEYFPNPTKFWPERWMRSENGNYVAVNDPNACLPFAIGARSCIGRKLAETQMIMSLAAIVSNFRLEVLEEVDMILHLVPVPERPIRVKLNTRNI